MADGGQLQVQEEEKWAVPSGVVALGFFFHLDPYTGFFFGMESLDGTSTPGGTDRRSWLRVSSPPLAIR